MLYEGMLVLVFVIFFVVEWVMELRLGAMTPMWLAGSVVAGTFP